MTKISTLLTINRLRSAGKWVKSLLGGSLIALFFTLGFSVNPIESQAQTTAQFGLGVSTYYHLGPLNRSSAASSCDRQSREIWWFSKEELLAKGMLPGANISSIGFFKRDQGNITAGDIRLKLHASGSRTATSSMIGGAPNTGLASTHLVGSTLLHDATYNVGNNIPFSSGWWTINFNSPLIWQGDTLWIIQEFEHENVGVNGISSYVAVNTAGGGLYWQGSWNNRPAEENFGGTRYYRTCNASKVYLPPTATNISTNNAIRPNTQFTFINCVELTCPADQVLNGTCNGITANWTAPTPVLNCGGTANLVQTDGPPIGSLLPVGTSLIGYRADDGQGNEAECSFTITVNDGGLPTIVCPPNVTVTGIESTCDAIVNFNPPNGQDNCPNFTVEQTVGEPSGFAFPRGRNLNRWLITDIFGNTDECDMEITVNVTDNTPPTIGCPEDLTVSTDPTVISAVGRSTTPSSFPQSGTFLVTAHGSAQTINSITVFVENWCGTATNIEVWWSPLGLAANPNTLCGTGGWIGLACQPHTGSALLGTCSSLTRVPVTITFPVPLVIPAGQQYSFAVISTNSLVDFGYTSTSTEWIETDGNITVQSHDGGSSTLNINTACLGNTPNPARGCVDGFSSSFYQISALFEYVPSTTCFATACVDEPSVADNCTATDFGTLASPVTRYGPDGGAPSPWPTGFLMNLFPLDASDILFTTLPITLRLHAKGDHNGVNSEEFDILDENGVVLATNQGNIQTTFGSCNGNEDIINLVISADDFNSWILDGEIGLTMRSTGSGIHLGYCDQAFFEVIGVEFEVPPFITNNNNGGTQICGEFPIGTHNFEYYATDGDGNQSTCTVDLTIQDLIPPVLQCPPDANILATPGNCTAVFAYTAPTATDLCSANNSVVSIGGMGAGGNIYPTGVNVESWQATDDAGNASTCSFDIVVGVPAPNPGITCPADIVGFTDADVCGTTIVYAAPVATDNCPGWVITRTTGFASGSFYPEGVTTTTFLVEDGGLQVQQQCEFTVTIIDDDPPSISCPENIIQMMSVTGTGECQAAVTAELDFYDNCGDYETSKDFVYTGGSAAIPPVGKLLTTIEITDHGTVNDLNVANVTGSHSWVNDLEFTLISPSNTEVTFYVSNCFSGAGFNMTIDDEAAGGIPCPPNGGGSYRPTGVGVSALSNFDGEGIHGTWTLEVNDVLGTFDRGILNGWGLAIEYTAKPSIVNTYNNGPSASDVYPLGTTMVGYKLTDNGGSSESCNFSITVVDDIAPTITCPGFITQREATDTYFYSGPEVTISEQNVGAVATAEIYIDRSTDILDINIVSLKGNHTWVNDLSFSLESPEGTIVPFWGGIICNSAMAWDMSIDDEAGSGIPCPASDLILGSYRPSGPGTAPLSDFDGEDMQGPWVLRIFDFFGGDQGTLTDFGLEVTYIEDYQVAADVTVVASAGECEAVATYGSPASDDDNCVSSTAGGVASNFGSGAIFPGGINIERFVATDDSGNTTECTIEVQVVDDAAPLVTCPADYVLNTEAGQCDNSTPAPLPAIFDCAPTNNVQNPQIYVLGSNIISWTITDVLNNKSAQCSFEITVVDEELPVLNCPPNQILSTDPGICESTAQWTAPIGVDNCPDVFTIQSEGPTAGTPLSEGVYVVGYETYDGSGNSAACDFTIEIQDLVAPGIICPPSRTLYADVNCETTIWYTAPGYSDNCPNPVLSQVSGLGVGPTVVNGNFYTEVWQAEDAAGNVTSCSFDVTVIDQFPPSIVCPADINVGTSSDGTGDCTAVVNFADATASDNCAPAPTVTQTSGPASGSSLGTGSHTVWFEAVDRDGNAVQCSFDITVTDDEMPTVNCPTPAYTSVIVPVGVLGTNLVFPAATGSDNCCSNVTNNLNGTDDMSGFFPVGTTEVTFYNTDCEGNQVKCGPVVVEVFDVVCPPDVYGSASSGSCNAILTTGIPTAISGSITYTNSQNGGSNASGTYPVGTTVVTYYIVDGTGATTACTFNVHVDEPIPPVITVCPSDLVVQTEPNRCTGRVHYNLVGTDNCPGEYWELREGLASPGDFPIGVTTVINALVDAAGNEALCEFTVTVEDNDVPFFTLCPGDVTENSIPNRCGARANWAPPTLNDNCTADMTASHNPGDFFPVGVTVVSYNGVDAGGNNAIPCTLNVTVLDVEDPTIDCPSDVILSSDLASCNVTFNYFPAAANDNCPGVLSALISGQGGGSYTVGGPYTEVWEATDASGNQAQCSFTISVEDNEKPSIACQPDIALGTNAGTCEALYFYGSASAGDNCPGVVVIQTLGLPSGSAFPVGVTKIKFRATDASGNWKECSYDVTVSDNENPAVTCPTNEVLGTSKGLCSAVFNYSVPAISDNCPGVGISQTAGLGSGALFPLGVSTVSFEISDAAGNNVECVFHVTVEDRDEPTIACPQDIVVGNDFRKCDAVVNYSVSSSDNCPSEIISQEGGLVSGSTYPLGVTTHAFRVTDGAGLDATCGFNVTVNDTEDPEIACPGDMTAETDAGLCTTVVTFSSAQFSDNCPNPTLVQFQGLLSGSAFPLGITTNMFGVIDASGNTNVCGMRVEVFDLELPAFTCPADYTVVLDPGQCEYLFDQEPQASDNCLNPSELIFKATHRNGDTLLATNGGITQICFDAGQDSSIYSPLYDVLITDVIQQNTANNGGHFPLPFGMIGDDFTQIANLKNIDVDISGWQFERQSAGTFDDVVYIFPANTILSAGTTIVLQWGLGLDNPGIGFYNTGTQSNAVFSSQQCGYILSDGQGNIIDVVALNNYNFDGSASPAPTVADWSGSVFLTPGSSAFFNITRIDGDTNMGSDWKTAWIVDPIRLGILNAEWSRTTDRPITECCFNVTVIDENGASISCPDDIVVGTDEGVCEATVDFEKPLVSDPCSAASEKFIQTPIAPYQFSGTMANTPVPYAGNISGALGPVSLVLHFNGDHSFQATETFTIEDENGVVLRTGIYTDHINADCIDDTAQITISAAQWNAYALDGMITFWMIPESNGVNTFCDNEAYWTATYLGELTAGLVSGFAPGDIVPVGTHANVYSVDDGAGNIATCSFNITVEDNEAPDCLLETPPSVTSISSQFAWIPNPSNPIAAFGITEFKMDIAASGTITDVNVARLLGEHSWMDDLDFDLIAPDGTGVRLVSRYGGGTDDFDVAFDDASALPHNTMPLSPMGNPFCTPATFPNCPVGPAYLPFNSLSVFNGRQINGTWTLRFTDNLGGIGGALLQWLLDITYAPSSSFNEVDNIIVDADPGQCSAIVNYGQMTGSDNCPGTVSVVQTSGQASGTGFPGGTTANEFLLTDGSGNTTECDFDVTVRDNTPPSIVCPPSVVVPNDPGTCDAVVTHPAVTAADNCPGWILQQVDGLPSGATYPVGVTTNTYMVIDAQSNAQPCSFTIEVKDWEAPSITCRNAVVFPTHPTAPFPVNPAIIYAGGSDNCDPAGGNLVIVSIDPSTVSCGNPIVQATITVQDAAGNSAQCTGTIIVDCAPLNVEVLSFTGYNENGKNILDWTTLTEINSDYFVVEKSLDGVNFEAIGKVGAAGNSSARLDYSLVDHFPAVGANYYRLKMVDRDASFEYSNIIVIDVVEAFEITNLIPNPTNGEVAIFFTADFEGALKLDLYNMTGQLVHTEMITASRGVNSWKLDLSTYAEGVYNIVLDNNKLQVRERVVKQ